MQSQRPAHFLFLFAAVLALVATGCDSDAGNADGPTELSGTFSATSLNGQLNANQGIDLLAAGGSLTLSFIEGGSVDGVFVVPDEISESSGLERQRLAGTYTLDPDGTLNLTFSESGSDTFVALPNIDWSYEDGEIRGRAGGFQALLERTSDTQ